MSQFESVLERRLSDVKVRLEPAEDFLWPTGSAQTRGAVRLRRSGSARDYQAVVGTSVTFKDVSDPSDHGFPMLVMTSLVATRTADRFRRSGIQYIDTAGNAWLEFGDTLIDIRGRTLSDTRLAATRNVPGSLFTPRRAQVVFALLTWPHLWAASVREISAVAGVSVGLAYTTVRALNGQGYARDMSPGRLSLLDLWTAAYPSGLGPKLALAAFHGKPTSFEPVTPTQEVLVSGAAAVADIVSAPTLTLYVSRLDPRLPIVNRWRVDGEPNIFVRRKFWETPIGAGKESGDGTVPWTLVYADLMVADDARLRTVAENWRDAHAAA